MPNCIIVLLGNDREYNKAKCLIRLLVNKAFKRNFSLESMCLSISSYTILFSQFKLSLNTQEKIRFLYFYSKVLQITNSANRCGFVDVQRCWISVNKLCLWPWHFKTILLHGLSAKWHCLSIVMLQACISCLDHCGLHTYIQSC